MHDDIKTVLLTKEEIDARVQEMGKQIAADYAGKELVVIVLLKGAAWFATDITYEEHLKERSEKFWQLFLQS